VGFREPPQREDSSLNLRALNDVIKNQVGSFALRNWDYDTADATASGALDGVIMTYVHSDGTPLQVTVWEFASYGGARKALRQTVSAAQSDGYQIEAEYPVEVEEEKVGQGAHLHLSGEPEVVVWTNGVLRIIVSSSDEDHLLQFYQPFPY
jgi:hypothetical protein